MKTSRILSRIRFISAPAGAGKSHVGRAEAVRMAKSGQRVLIACPTLDLMDEHFRRLMSEQADLTITKIATAELQPGDDEPSSVIGQLVSSLWKPIFGGEIILCTHEALRRLPGDCQEFRVRAGG